jgi:hypothetical protein
MVNRLFPPWKIRFIGIKRNVKPINPNSRTVSTTDRQDQDITLSGVEWVIKLIASIYLRKL